MSSTASSVYLDTYISQNAHDGNIGSLFHTNSGFEWWQVSFPNDTIVRTVFIMPVEHCCEITRNVFKLSIGNQAPPSSNPVCVDFNLASGVYECPSAMTG